MTVADLRAYYTAMLSDPEPNTQLHARNRLAMLDGGEPESPPRTLFDRARRCPHFALPASCCSGEGFSCRRDPDELVKVTIEGDCAACPELPQA